MVTMLILGIESSCDETGVALYDLGQDQLLSQALHSQISMHADYGGVVPELASRDHIRRVLPLTEQVLKQANRNKSDIGLVAYTQGPGLSGALLVGAATASALAYSLGVASMPIHHLEGHLLSPLLSSDPPQFPFICLLVSGGHTQLLKVEGVGQYELLGDTVDDAAGEAFDKSAKLMGLGYPGGPALAKLATQGRTGRFKLPKPMQHSGNLDFSFSGLKTAVLTTIKRDALVSADYPYLAADIQAAIVQVLVSKCTQAIKQTGLTQIVVAGGVSANTQLREQLNALSHRLSGRAYFPELHLCSDNGAMIAFAAAMRVKHLGQGERSMAFDVKPRWALNQINRDQINRDQIN